MTDLQPSEHAGMAKAEATGPATAERSSEIRLAALAALAILTPLSLNLYMPALPDIGAWFGVDIQRIELSVGVFLIGLGAGQIVGAPISDRFGRRPSTMLGLALFAASTIGILLCRSADQFVALRVVQGVSLGIAFVNVAAVIADLTDTEGTARSLSLIQAAQAAGYIATPIVGALMVGVLAWQSAFVILLAYCGLLGAVLWVRLPETVSRSDRRRRAVFREAVRGYREVLGKPRAMAYAIGMSFAVGASFVYFTDAAFLYMEWFGIGPRSFGLLLALSTVAFAFGAVLNVRLLVRHRADRLVPVACASQCLVAFLLLAHVTFMTPSLLLVIVLVMAVSGSLGFIAGNAGACFLAHFPGHRAIASGIMGALPTVVGGAVGVGLTGIHDGTPVTTAAGIAGCAVVGMLAIAFARPADPALDDTGEDR